ncbi:unnamed protein product [Paramecium sonneborni]|uniref:Uncharacterized protein n=1 Tax=Paramecium sonneborni TaxID=65129 RepID=A0A8S1P2N4_9CILI|nr:unnamed protein product [Paramecium sonneborni]
METKRIQNINQSLQSINQFFALQNHEYVSIINNDLQQVSHLNYSYLNLTECLQSTSDSYELFSVCKNEKVFYWLTFNLEPFRNIVKLQVLQILGKISNITKISSILDQKFILASLKGNIQQLYWFNQTYDILQYIGFEEKKQMYCQDFSITQLPQTNEENKKKLILIINLQGNLVNFFDMQIQNNTQKIQILEQFGCSSVIKYNELVISNGVVLISSIPTYSNLPTMNNSIYQNGILMIQFQQNNGYIVGCYYLDNLREHNLSLPYVMQGSFYTSSNQYAMIMNQYYLEMEERKRKIRKFKQCLTENIEKLKELDYISQQIQHFEYYVNSILKNIKHIKNKLCYNRQIKKLIFIKQKSKLNRCLMIFH